MARKKPTLVILRGGPSTGKSTICEEIRKKDPKIIWLHVDSFKRFVNSGKPNTDRDHWYHAASATLDYFLSQNFTVIAECIFQYRKHVNIFLKTAKKHHAKALVFELVANPKSLIKRDRGRKGVPEGLRPPLPEKTIKSLTSLVNENHFPGAIIIKTDQTTIKDTVDQIFKVIR
jgi:predicted kinase